jgi:hypothetical protein
MLGLKLTVIFLIISCVEKTLVVSTAVVMDGSVVVVVVLNG